MAKLRQDRFLIGYKPRGNCVYGKDTRVVQGRMVRSISSFTDPMTMKQALRSMRKFYDGAVIYELRRVEQ